MSLLEAGQFFQGMGTPRPGELPMGTVNGRSERSLAGKDGKRSQSQIFADQYSQKKAAESSMGSFVDALNDLGKDAPKFLAMLATISVAIREAIRSKL